MDKVAMVLDFMQVHIFYQMVSRVKMLLFLVKTVAYQ